MCESWASTLTDRDGDVWTWDPNDELYTSPGLSGRTRAQLEREYGPLRNGDVPDIRLLLAEALEDVARKLREGY